jgi:hypothetical protein
MPDLRGLSARHAAAWLSHLGVEFRITGQGVVTEQYPEPGSDLPLKALLTSR